MASVLLDLAMIFGPVAGYVSQYQDIVARRSAEGFSSMVSLILLVANTLRVFFWFCRPFGTSLLLQSIVMIAAQLLLVQLITRFPTAAQRGRRFTDFEWAYFWNWEDFHSYAMFTATFSVLVGMTTAMLSSSYMYAELLGYAALLIESTLGIPQVMRNMSQQSTAGLSKTLIATWVLGDAFKTFYFVVEGAPFQFLLCGIIQLTVDAILCAQLYLYRGADAVLGHHSLGLSK
jgi:hypothetical protein